MKKTEQENMSGEITKFNPESLSEKFSSSIVEFTVQDNNGTLVVDSRVVADMVDKRHADLLRDIRKQEDYLLNAKVRSVDFFIKSSYKDSTGRELESYLLTRKGCEYISNKLTGQKGATFTATYIDKFHEMEQQLASHLKVPTTMKEVLQIAMEQQEKIEYQEKRIKHLEPHANFSKEYLKSEDTVQVEILAKLLTKQGIKIGRNRLFEYLRDNGYVHVVEGYNIPTQKSINGGLMELEVSFFYDQKGNLRIGQTTKITTKGQAYFYKKFLSAEQSYSAHGFQKIS